LVEIDPNSNLSRSAGYAPLTLKFTWAGPKKLLQGHLEVSIDGNGSRSFVIDKLVLSEGERVMEVMVPSPPIGYGGSVQRTVYFTFVSDDGTRHELQPAAMRFPGQDRRTTVVASINEDKFSEQRKNENHYLNKFSMERFNPSKDDRRNGSIVPVLLSLTRTYTAETFPTLPLEHCVNDLVVLTGEQFASLSLLQLDALVSWTKAGGSVALIVNNKTNLSVDQMDRFLSFANQTAENARYVRQRDGSIETIDSRSAPQMYRVGLGRSVIAVIGDALPEEQDYSTRNWNRAVSFLWKFHSDQPSQVNGWNKWSWNQHQQLLRQSQYQYNANSNYNYNYQNNSFASQLLPIHSHGTDSLLHATFPRGMSVVPLWLIGFILTAYVIMIGPIDYFTLGALKLRKYTWITFPVVSILFAVSGIMLSNRMLGGNSTGRSVTFVDVLDDGTVARTNTLGLTFSPTNRTIETELRQQLYNSVGNDQKNSPPVIVGALPSRGMVRQSVAKWSPELTRTMEIPLKQTVEPSGFDWSVPINPLDATHRENLKQRIRTSFGDDSQAIIIRHTGVDMQQSNNENGLNRFVILDGNQINGANVQYGYQGNQRYSGNATATVTYNASGDVVYGSEFVQTDFATMASVRVQPGLFSLVSQVSPKCDAELEDLAILDGNNPDESLLMIITQDETGMRIYRHLIETKAK